MLLSVCMIVKDEVPRLSNALRSLAGRFDELVIVDTGSTDGTPELAARAGATVLHQPWADDFSQARNHALAAASGAYCLMLDADEEVDASSWPAFLAFLQEARHPLGRVQVVSPTADGVVRDTITRVCAGGGRFRYEGRIHEQLVPATPGPVSRGDTGLVLRHGGYTADAVARKGSAARNARLLERALAEQPGDPYLEFQLGRTLAATDPVRARAALDRARAAAPADAPYSASLARELGEVLRKQGEPRAALSLVRAASLRAPTVDLSFLEGLLCMDLDDVPGMIRAFERCIEAGDGAGESTVEGAGTFRPHHNLGLFYELTGDLARARTHYEAALRARADFEPSLTRLAGLRR